MSKHDRYWVWCKPHLVKITGGRFWGLYGKCIAHDLTMRIVTFPGTDLGNQRYRIREQNIVPVWERGE